MVSITLCGGLMILAFVMGIIVTLLAVNYVDKRLLNGGGKK